MFKFLLILTIMKSFTVPQLPYGYESLAPVISKETLEFHHDKHVLAYVNNLNKLIAGTEFEGKSLEDIVRNSTGGVYNNAAQVYNHTFYFEQFGKSTQIEGKLADAIKKQWGTIDKFKEEFNDAGATLFGSGWVWLACDSEGSLKILKESNAGCPLTQGLVPLLTFDVWEHAYYIDYRNRRLDYLADLWKILDWNVMETRFKSVLK